MDVFLSSFVFWAKPKDIEKRETVYRKKWSAGQDQQKRDFGKKILF